MLTLNLETIKNAIRVDHDFDDEQIEYLLLPAAEQEVQGAISGYGKADQFYKNNALYNLAVINYIGHHYENRSTTSQFEKHDVPASSLALIQTLRGSYETWKSDASNTE